MVLVCPQCGSVYAGVAVRCALDDAALVTQENDPLVGRLLDRYQIEERLGVGGMGCVYRARHAVIDRAYAIKVLYGDFANNEKFQARFRREATAISKVQHPNVVRVEDFGRTSKGLTFLAMELVRGKTLESELADVGQMSPARAAHIARQVAGGLDAAHQLGFVHRDVKPANIMLTAEPTPDFVKILDFGTVSLRTLPLDERLTAVGHIIGTPTYMAPEQAQNPGVDPTADVYALGVILFEMLAGHPPFTARTRAAAIVQHLNETPPLAPPSQGLEQLVASMLRKSPLERPRSMRDVIEELDRLELSDELAPTQRPATPPQDAEFFGGPTNQILLGLEQDQLRRIYAAFEADGNVRDTAADEPSITPNDPKPTPPDDSLPMGGARPPSSNTMVVRERKTAVVDRPTTTAAPDEQAPTRIDHRAAESVWDQVRRPVAAPIRLAPESSPELFEPVPSPHMDAAHLHSASRRALVARADTDATMSPPDTASDEPSDDVDTDAEVPAEKTLPADDTAPNRRRSNGRHVPKAEPADTRRRPEPDREDLVRPVNDAALAESRSTDDARYAEPAAAAVLSEVRPRGAELGRPQPPDPGQSTVWPGRPPRSGSSTAPVRRGLQPSSQWLYVLGLLVLLAVSSAVGFTVAAHRP